MQVQESAEGTEQMHLKHLSYVLGVYTMGGGGDGGEGRVYIRTIDSAKLYWEWSKIYPCLASKYRNLQMLQNLKLKPLSVFVCAKKKKSHRIFQTRLPRSIPARIVLTV